MTEFIQDTPKMREYAFIPKNEEVSFRFYFQMGFITPIPEIWTRKQYKNYTVELVRHDWTGEWEYMFYPTVEGIQHDYDCADGESFSYCGNCLWSQDLDDVIDCIDEAQPLNPEQSIKDYLKKFNPK